jgi:isocitrate dehydrogenase
MSDSGREGDAIAGDGIYSGMLAPAQTGFASFNGTIRTELNYVVNGQTGFVFSM